MCILIFMSKSSNTAKFLPKPVQNGLISLGKDLRIARDRREESLRDWAGRLGTSVPTLVRMEAGDPTVGVAVYATSLWLMGMLDNLTKAADPENDRIALEMDIHRTSSKRKV